MEPVTHILTGACLARSGFNRRVAYATGAMAVAAEFPDIDTVWSLRGPVSGFEHHRGITHTFAGIPFEAALLVLGFLLLHRVRGRAGKSPKAPVRWGALYGCLVLALLSHLLLDYTNNYGLRPYFPFNAHWYAASIVFIFDPLLFLLLLAGLLMPALLGLVGREMGSRNGAFPGRGWARAALLGVVLLWSVRWAEHARAVALAGDQTLRAPATSADIEAAEGSAASAAPRPLLLPQRTVASPDPLNPFRWYTASDFGPAYQMGVADTRAEQWSAGQVLAKMTPTPALEAAERTRLGRVYLDWSEMPLISTTTDVPDGVEAPDLQPEARLTVNFSDLRFMGDLPLLHRAGLPPLTGQVVLDGQNQPVAEGMDSKFGH